MKAAPWLALAAGGLVALGGHAECLPGPVVVGLPPTRQNLAQAELFAWLARRRRWQEQEAAAEGEQRQRTTPAREQAVEIAMLLRLAVEHLLCVHALRQPGGETATVRNATALLAEIEAVAILVQ